MRILLDECLLRELALEFPGHQVITVQQSGWSGLKNGELLRRASGRFDLFLTIDQFLSNQHGIPDDLAVITIRARSNRIQDLRPVLPAVLKALSEARPGNAITVGV